jgi:hypothetical protein
MCQWGEDAGFVGLLDLIVPFFRLMRLRTAVFLDLAFFSGCHSRPLCERPVVKISTNQIAKWAGILRSN